jgi:hypothetical protein
VKVARRALLGAFVFYAWWLKRLAGAAFITCRYARNLADLDCGEERLA